jgi:hypothetical protein
MITIMSKLILKLGVEFVEDLINNSLDGLLIADSQSCDYLINIVITDFIVEKLWISSLCDIAATYDRTWITIDCNNICPS